MNEYKKIPTGHDYHNLPTDKEAEVKRVRNLPKVTK